VVVHALDLTRPGIATGGGYKAFHLIRKFLEQTITESGLA
jgi:hypothetical protein